MRAGRRPQLDAMKRQAVKPYLPRIISGAFIATIICALAGLDARGQQKSITLPDDNSMAQLKAGRNVEVTRNKCISCHSTDYIVRQPGSDAKKWEAEVMKMIKVFGAPISEADAKAIIDYLATSYGPEPNPAPAVERTLPDKKNKKP
jgi:sulfite dehydrogenase (cytochrome) subunit B